MTTGTNDSGDRLKSIGLISGHAYTLISAFNFKLSNGQTIRLVKIRNPWGDFGNFLQCTIKLILFSMKRMEWRLV